MKVYLAWFERTHIANCDVTTLLGVFVEKDAAHLRCDLHREGYASVYRGSVETLPWDKEQHDRIEAATWDRDDLQAIGLPMHWFVTEQEVIGSA